MPRLLTYHHHKFPPSLHWMMLSVSGKGKAGRHAFETRPLHNEHGW